MTKLSYVVLILTLGLLVAPVASAWHTNDTITESKSCSGPHCTIIGFWQAWAGDRPPNFLLASSVGKISLHGTASLYTSLSAPATGIVANCEAGETFEVPIQASGEIVGAGKAFWDSPPIQFQPQGLVRAITDGIPFSCELGPDGEGQARCAREFNKPIEGEWHDTWTTAGLTGGSVVCTTEDHGKAATCVVAPGTTGAPRIALSRSVNSMFWQIGDPQFRIQPAVLPAVLTSSAPLVCRAAMAPNLTIEAISIFPNNPDTSEPIDVNAVIANTGNQNVAATVSQVRFDEGADGSWNVGPLDVQTGAIALNQTEVARWVNAWQPPTGTHRVEVCADATNTVQEANEADNCKILVFVVRPAVLTCSPASQSVLAKTAIVAGSIATFETNGNYTATWSAPDGETKTGVGKTFSTTFGAPPHSATVTVTDGGQTATCAVSIAIGDPTPGPTSPTPTSAPGDGTWCGPLKQTQAAGNSASFLNPDGTPVNWSAPGGTPDRGVKTTTFSTTYTVLGDHDVYVVPPLLYDVTGDGWITPEDADAVSANLGATTGPGNGSPWQNQTNRFDVTGDGHVVPQDRLAIVNYMNDHGAVRLPGLTCRVEVTRAGSPTPTPTPHTSGGPFLPGPIREEE